MWITIASAVGALLIALIKGIWGVDKPILTRIVEVDGEPTGPKLAARLRNLSR